MANKSNHSLFLYNHSKTKTETYGVGSLTVLQWSVHNDHTRTYKMLDAEHVVVGRELKKVE